MATYTRDQVIKWNSKAGNGFKTDLSMLMTHGEKRLVKTVITGDNKYTTYSLYFRESYSRFEKQLEIRMTKRLWTRTDSDSLYWSEGLGYSVAVNTEKHDKKNFNKLCEVSHTLTDEYITLLFNEVNSPEDNGHGVVLPSPKE